MWIEALEIGGFMQLRGRFTFARELTVIYGPNEAGKSALQDAVLRSWFGFSRSERRRSGGSSILTETEPWQGGAFGVNALVHETRDGRSVLISWSFADHSITVRDRNTGEDLSAHVRGLRQDVTFGEWLLGLGVDDYCEACCLFQVAVEPIAHSDGLVGELRVAVEKGTPDGGVGAADELLKAFLKEHLGFHSAHYNPLSAGEISRVARELAETEKVLEESNAARDEIRELAVKKTTLAKEIDGARSELQVILQQLRHTECVALRRRWEEVKASRRRMDRRPSEPVILDATVRDHIAGLRQRLETLDGQSAELEAEIPRHADRIGELEGRRRELVVARDRVEAYLDLDVSGEDHVRELESQVNALEDQRDEPSEAEVERDPELARFRTERARLRALALDRSAGSWRRGLVIAASAVAVLAAVGAAITPAALAGLAVAAGLVWLARPRAASSGREELAAALEGFGVPSLEELERRVDEEDRRVAQAEGRHEERQSRVQRRGETRADLEQELAETLHGIGVEADGSVAEAARGYLTSCSKHGEAIGLQAQINAIDLELNHVREPRRNLEARQRELEGVKADLMQAYAQLGIEAGDIDEANAAYSNLLSRAEADAQDLADVREAEAALGVALAGRSEEQLKEALDAAEQALREHVARYGELTVEVGDSAELTRSLAELHEQAESSVAEASALDARIEERETDCGDPAELEERISALRERKAQLEQGCRAVRIAREGLAEAAAEAYREFAPHLNEALERNLPRVTDGRYARATVGDALEIHVVAPETGQLVPVELLSRGTQDQIALVERLAVAQMLDPTHGAVPLLLDDPFGHTDPDRRGRALELIAELAESRQIILTTDDPAVLESARRVAPALAVIELAAPKARDEAALAGEAT